MHMLIPAFLSLMLATAAFQAAAQERYTPSSDGDEITDSKED